MKAIRMSNALVLLALLAPVSHTADKLAIRDARIITMAGEVIEKGTVVIENGRIKAVGANVEIPWDAEVIEAAGKTVIPGLIVAHSNQGIDRANENVPVTPFISVLDAINPVDRYFEDALRSGVTAIHVIPGNATVIGGKGMVVKPHGLSVESMTIDPIGGMKLSVAPKSGSNRMTQMAEMRRAFREFREHIQDVAEKKVIADMQEGNEGSGEGEQGGPNAETRQDEKVDPFKVLKKQDLDIKRQDMFDLVRGRMPVFIYCDKAMDVFHAIQTAKDNGFLNRTTLVVGTECWKAAAEIKSAGLSVVLPQNFVHTEKDPLTGKETKTYLTNYFHDQKIPFAISAMEGRSTTMITSSLLMQAAYAVRQGLERRAALKSITLTPAKILGLEKRLGSIEAGKDGNVVILSGDPLGSTTWVEQVVIQGERVYDKKTDTRLQKLTGDTKDGGK